MRIVGLVDVVLFHLSFLKEFGKNYDNKNKIFIWDNIDLSRKEVPCNGDGAHLTLRRKKSATKRTTAEK